MSDSFNNFGVPWYADGDTPAIRPQPIIRDLPEWLREQKAARGQRLQFIYKWIRENWKEGDRLLVAGLRPKFSENGTFLSNEKNRFDGKTGAFVKLDTTHSPMIRITWDDGHKYMMGPVEFYHHAFKQEQS